MKTILTASRSNWPGNVIMKIGIVSIVFLFCGLLKIQSAGLSETERQELKKEPLDSLSVKSPKLKVSGYMQVQYQYAETDADGYTFKTGNRENRIEQEELKSFGRFGIRRGRIKITFDDGLVQTAFQTNITEKGLNIIDASLNVKDPWLGSNMFKAGIFETPFGHEVAYSASLHESPERSRIMQSLFPDECDLGVMLTLQPAATSPWHFLKLEAGLFAGNGIRLQIDSRMDFAGHLTATRAIGTNMTVSGGFSTYLGGMLQYDSSVYTVKDQAFVLTGKSESNIGKYAKRQYVGLDAQFRMNTAAGLTHMRAEYISGIHPGNASCAYGFKYNAMESEGPVYMRKISGGYVLLSQELGRTPFTAVVKYDRYNPNTEISGNYIDSKGEITMSNFGFGFLWTVYQGLKMTAYYNIVKNETTDKLKNTTDTTGKITAYGYENDRKDNVFTLRLQYKF